MLRLERPWYLFPFQSYKYLGFGGRYLVLPLSIDIEASSILRVSVDHRCRMPTEDNDFSISVIFKWRPVGGLQNDFRCKATWHDIRVDSIEKPDLEYRGAAAGILLLRGLELEICRGQQWLTTVVYTSCSEATALRHQGLLLFHWTSVSVNYIICFSKHNITNDCMRQYYHLVDDLQAAV